MQPIRRFRGGDPAFLRPEAIAGLFILKYRPLVEAGGVFNGILGLAVPEHKAAVYADVFHVKILTYLEVAPNELYDPLGVSLRPHETISISHQSLYRLPK